MASLCGASCGASGSTFNSSAEQHGGKCPSVAAAGGGRWHADVPQQELDADQANPDVGGRGSEGRMTAVVTRLTSEAECQPAVQRSQLDVADTACCLISEARICFVLL